MFLPEKAAKGGEGVSYHEFRKGFLFQEAGDCPADLKGRFLLPGNLCGKFLSGEGGAAQQGKKIFFIIDAAHLSVYQTRMKYNVVFVIGIPSPLEQSVGNPGIDKYRVSLAEQKTPVSHGTLYGAFIHVDYLHLFVPVPGNIPLPGGGVVAGTGKRRRAVPGQLLSLGINFHRTFFYHRILQNVAFFIV